MKLEKRKASVKSHKIDINSRSTGLLFFFILKIIPRISLRRPDISSYISPEGQHHINYDGRTHCKNRCIDKVLADLTG